ncbi:hypothetical protein WDW37_06185 [Bdellovibrionota bacterium FG-1]
MFRLIPITALILLILTAGLAIQAHADPIEMIEVKPAAVEAGNELSWGECPCFRWTIQVQAASGKIETQSFLISSEALFQFRETNSANFTRQQSQLFKAGAIEALWKQGHVGLSFDGITWGNDRDRSYADLLRTGLYGLIQVVKTEAVSLKIRSGYVFESERVNYGSQIHRGTFEQAAILNWHSRLWSGQVSAHVGFDDGQFLAPSQPRVGAEVSTRVRFLKLRDLEAGLNFSTSVEHDPFRTIMGLNPDNLILGLSMDLTYDVLGEPNANP